MRIPLGSLQVWTVHCALALSNFLLSWSLNILAWLNDSNVWQGYFLLYVATTYEKGTFGHVLLCQSRYFSPFVVCADVCA